MGTKEDESSTGHIWATGLHHVMSLSHLAHFLKLMNCFVSLIFQIFSGRSKPQIRGSTCIMKLCVLWFADLK